MGIYSDGAVYGVSLSIGTRSIIERTYEQKMTGPQIQEIKHIYDTLSIEDKHNITVRFYTSAVATYTHENMSSFMTWFPGTRSTLETLFTGT
jgi:hypothetical protein